MAELFGQANRWHGSGTGSGSADRVPTGCPECGGIAAIASRDSWVNTCWLVAAFAAVHTDRT